MPVVVGQVEMNDLAQKISKMKYNRARNYIRRLDKNVRLDMLRVSIGNEILTRFALPDKGLWITLVEAPEDRGLSERGMNRIRYNFVETRVEPIPSNVLKDKQLSAG